MEGLDFSANQRHRARRSVTTPAEGLAGPCRHPERWQGDPCRDRRCQRNVPVSRRHERHSYARRAAAIQYPQGEGHCAWSLAMLSHFRRQCCPVETGRDKPAIQRRTYDHQTPRARLRVASFIRRGGRRCQTCRMIHLERVGARTVICARDRGAPFLGL